MQSSAAPVAGQPLIRALQPRQGEPIAVGLVTAVLGAANAGKSELLRDVVRLLANREPGAEETTSDTRPPTVVLEDATLVGKLTLERLTFGLTRLPGGDDEVVSFQGFGPDLRSAVRRDVGHDLKSVLHRPQITARAIAGTPLGEFLALRVAYLDVATRCQLVQPGAVAHPLRVPDNLLQALQDAPPELLEELQLAFLGTFGRELRLDTTQRTELRLRVGSNFPAADPRNLEAVAAWQALQALDTEGEGWQSFVAVVLAVLMSRGRLVLIDQPELNLSAVAARHLGRWLAARAPLLQVQVIATTHSPHLAYGLLEGSSETQLVCLRREGDATRMAVVEADVARLLGLHPLLASQQALDSTIAEGVVLLPDAEDALLLQTVAGADSELRFLHAHGPEQLVQVADILRRAGLPLSVVAGLDVFRSEARFTALFHAVTGESPPATWLATRDRLGQFVEKTLDTRVLSQATHEVESFLDQLKKERAAANAPEPPSPAQMQAAERWSELQRKGLDVMPPELKVWVEDLIDDLKARGIFIARRGSLRNWFEAAPASHDSGTPLLRALRQTQTGATPPELRALAAEVAAFSQASAAASRAASGRHRT